MRETIKDGFEFVSINYPFFVKEAIKIVDGAHTVAEYQAYIQEKGIESAEIIMPDLDITKLCPFLKHLKICPSYNATDNYDFSPLYDMPEIQSLSCQNIYGSREQYRGVVDYGRIHGLVDLHVNANKGSLNFQTIKTLKSLCVGSFRGRNRDLTDLFCSKELDTLRLIECSVHSLEGIQTSDKMQCVYLEYNRCLRDISSLKKVKRTIRTLRINNCPKIEDFSVLGELDNLELLELSGNNELPSLAFLKTMKSLKTLILSMNVKDGDLSPCLDLSYVSLSRNRRHYNLKGEVLPKGQYVRGNEDIELWRRLE